MRVVRVGVRDTLRNHGMNRQHELLVVRIMSILQ